MLRGHVLQLFYIQGYLLGLKMLFLLSFSKLDEQMPFLPPPSSEAIAALVSELRNQLNMALFGVDIILNINTHTLTIIDINIFPGNAHTGTYSHTYIQTKWYTDTLFSPSGYEGVPEFFSALLSHIESVLDKQTSACLQASGSPESTQTTGGPSAATTDL